MVREVSRRRRRRQSTETDTIRSQAVPQLPWRKVDNLYPPMEPLSADQVEAIHNASLDLLENTGMEVMGDEPLDIFRKAGAAVDQSTGMVRLDRGIVEQALSTAPSEFMLTPRNADRAIKLGGNRINFGFVSGAPNVHDCVNGRRGGNLTDFKTLMKFAQYFNCIHFMGNQVAPPIELPPNNRHLDTYKVQLTYTDKVISGVPIGAGRIQDYINMVAIARGLSVEELAHDRSCVANININSPRKLDAEMAYGAMELARHNQATVVTPFTLMGAMTPVTMAAALTQQNAEALLGITLTQLVRPGAPVIYGAFTSNVDMRSGAPTFGTPENSKANLAGAQFARRYRLPHRTSGCNASNAVDAQAAYETLFAQFGAVMGHGNIVYHAVGWLEGGLVASFEKVILDIEIVQHMMEFLAPIDTSQDEIGLNAIESVDPGGHFFGADHTLARYETAFYQPLLSDWRNSESWLEAGGPTATERATAIWQKVLEDYEEPTLPADRLEEMDAYIAKRREAIGDGDP